MKPTSARYRRFADVEGINAGINAFTRVDHVVGH
jgi:hypothetical protein